MRRFSRGRAATDDEAPPQATGTSEAAGDAATDAQQAGGTPLHGDDPATAPTAVEVPGADPAAPGAASATTGDPAAAASATTDDAVAAARATTAADGESGTAQATTGEAGTTAEEPAPGRDLPAGIDLEELAAAPAPSARRGRVRRRLGYLRHVRELLLRDLGGFYAEAYRSERGPDAHRRLLDIKARRLATLDAEVHELEARLSEPHAETILREPGIGGTCPECGELFGSEARFCSRCAAPLRGRAARDRAQARAAAGSTGTGAPDPVTGDGERMTTASLWGRRRTPVEQPSEPTRAGDMTQAVEGREPAGDAAAGGGEEASRGGAIAGSAKPGSDAPATGATGTTGARDQSAARESDAPEGANGEDPTRAEQPARAREEHRP